MTKFLKRCLIVLSIVFGIMCHTMLPAIPLFDEYGKLTDGSKEICNILGISDKVTDAETFYEYFRENIYRSRPFVGARYSYCPYVSKLDENSFNRLLDACEKLQITIEILPKNEHYDYIVVFGNSTGCMKMSRDFVYQKLGKIFEENPNIKVYVVTGHRNLDKDLESKDIINKLIANELPCTESYAAKEIWDNKNYKSNIECVFVNVEENEIPKDGRGVNRANTRDTVKKLLETKKLKPGSMLCVSVNPFIWHDHNACQNVLFSYGWHFDNSSLETVGPCIDIEFYCNMLGRQRMAQSLLNNIANCAYEEYNFLKNHNLE